MVHSTEADYEPQVVEYPILQAWPEFFWMNERDRSDAFEARAIAKGGEGYRDRPRER